MQIIFKIFKFSIFLFFSILSLLFILFLIDATDFDRHFVNRSKIEISYIHLNSRHSYKFSNYLKKNYFLIYEKFFNKHFKDRWSIESKVDREQLPKKKILKAKKDNFGDQLYDLRDYSNNENWTRSHGNYFSTRFSSLKKINIENVKNLKLAWIYNPETNSKSKKENQANIIFFKDKVFLPDVENNIVALNAITGKKIWEYKIDGGIAAKRGLILWKQKDLDHNARIFFTDNKRYLYSLDTDGNPIKSFGNNGKTKIGLTPLPPIIYNDQLILITTDNVIQSFDLNSGKINWKFKVNKTKNNLIFPNFTKGSPWGGLSLDKKRGLLFFTTGNPEPWHVGVYREGDNLYANSLVAFDLKSKKIKWHFQEIPHDVWNYDLAAAPILTMVKRNDQLVDVVVSVSKLGNVLIFERESGKPIFDIIYERAPVSNIPGERTSDYQVNIKLPEQICRSKFNTNELTKFDDDFVETFNKDISNYNFGYPSPPLIGKKTISIGSCVRWAGGSVDTNKNILYITSDNVASIISIVKNDDEKFSYYHEWDTFSDNDGYPAIKPPWGAITALNLNTGKIIWKKPFGKIKELEEKNIFNTGSKNRAGLTASSGNLIFASGTEDNLFRAYNSLNGDELWSYQMDSAGSAPPTIFQVEGKQFVLVPAYEKNGSKVYAFTLD